MAEQSPNSSQSDFTESDNDEQGNILEEKSGEECGENSPSDFAGQSFEEILALKDTVGLRKYRTAIGLEDLENKRKRRKVGHIETFQWF